MNNKNWSKQPNILIKKSWRFLVCSDEHCGHFSGLTHPDYQGKFITDDLSKHNKLSQIQRELWNFFETEIHTLNKEKKIDIFVNNGDFVDGNGWRSAGTELITTDRHFQIQMAKKVVETVDANTNIIVAGTAYHTGEQEDWEEVLAKEINCKFENHAWIDINGKVFDIKHHIGSSSVPQGRSASVAKEALWAKLWAEAKLIPNPINYLIRSHAHYFSMVDDGDIIAMITPALQAFGSKYGARRCSGIPKIGFISFDIDTKGNVTMRKHFASLPVQVAKATKFN
jgi:hypothetical protein